MAKFVLMRPGRTKTEYLNHEGEWSNNRILRLVYLSRVSAESAKRAHGGYVVADTNCREDDIESAMRVFRNRDSAA